MKVLIGIDGDVYEQTLNLVRRLNFTGAEFVLAHSIQTTSMGPVYELGQEVYGVDTASMMQEAAEALLENAMEKACERGLKGSTAVLIGSPPASLMDFADRDHSQVIAVYSERRGTLGSLFMGSTTRGLVNAARQSVLVAKGDIPREGGVRIVFATDHSAYSNRALDRFLEYAPRGVSEIFVFSAAHLRGASGDRATQVEAKIERQRKEGNIEWVNRLQAAGYTASSGFSLEEPNDAIRGAMESKRADLLLVGAQGHGFLHRLMLGSVALHHVAVESYPVFVIRAEE